MMTMGEAPEDGKDAAPTKEQLDLMCGSSGCGPRLLRDMKAMTTCLEANMPAGMSPDSMGGMTGGMGDAEKQMEQMCIKDDAKNEYCMLRVHSIIGGDDTPTTCEQVKEIAGSMGCCVGPFYKLISTSGDSPLDATLTACLKAVADTAPPCLAPGGDPVKAVEFSIPIKNVKCSGLNQTFFTKLFEGIATAANVGVGTMSLKATKEENGGCTIIVNVRAADDAATTTAKTEIEKALAAASAATTGVPDVIKDAAAAIPADATTGDVGVGTATATETTKESDVKPAPIEPASSATRMGMAISTMVALAAASFF
jgi:hypothetical protein